MRRAIAVTFVGNAVPPLFALASAPILANGLGVDGRGEVAAATAPLLLCMAALSLGIPEALTHYGARGSIGSRSRAALYLLALAGVGILGTSVVAVFAPLLAAGDSFLAQLLIFATLGLAPALVVAGMRGRALGEGRWKTVAFERCLGASLRLAAIAFLAASGTLTPLSASLAIAASTFAGGVVYLRRQGGANIAPSRPISSRQFFFYGSRIWIGSIAGILLLRLSQVLMTPLAGVYELGIFAVAVNLSEAVLVFNAAVRDVVFSTSSGTHRPDIVARAARVSTIVTLLAGIALAASSPWLVPALFGAAFAPAVQVTFILLVGVVLGNPGSVTGAGLSGFGRPELRSFAIAVGLIVNVIALIIFVPWLGAAGAAVASTLGSATSGLLSLLAYSRVSGVSAVSFLGLTKADLNSLARLVRWRKS